MGVIINFLLAKELELCPKLIDKTLVNILSFRKVPYVTLWLCQPKKKKNLCMSHGLSYFSAVLVDISLDPYIQPFFLFVLLKCVFINKELTYICSLPQQNTTSWVNKKNFKIIFPAHNSQPIPFVDSKYFFLHFKPKVIHNIHYLTYQVAKIHEPLWFKDSIECDWTYSSNIVYV